MDDVVWLVVVRLGAFLLLWLVADCLVSRPYWCGLRWFAAVLVFRFEFGVVFC